MNRSWFSLLKVVVLAFGMTACEYIHDDLEPCPSGLRLAFEYDYNLQRADMFADHVKSVTVYVFDENGQFIVSKTESADFSPSYEMELPLDPGRYQVVTLAGQKPLAEMPNGMGAKFRLTEPAVGDSLSAITLTLDHDATGRVMNEGMPLDTIWHGMELEPIEVVIDKVTTDTVSLVRNTKQINVALRDLDDPAAVDVNDFEFRIYDRNARLLWDNSVDETDSLTYMPYRIWNTEDKPLEAGGEVGPGRIAHADFMTSRLIYHEAGKDDAILSITNKTTGVEVVRVNLADMLSRLRTSADIYRYTPQQFLDRGYDYQLTFFLKGDTWDYVNIEIAVLSWAKRIQYEHIEL